MELPQRDAVRDAYATITQDLGELWALCGDDIVFHVAGEHPLSGSYVGRDAVRVYVDAVRRVPGDRPGFTITSVLSDPHKDLLLVEGTARHGAPAFVRTVVHVLRFRDGSLVEYWDYPFDLQAENAFWTAHVVSHLPCQRRPGETPAPPLHGLVADLGTP